MKVLLPIYTIYEVFTRNGARHGLTLIVVETSLQIQWQCEMSRLVDVKIYSIASCWDEKDNKGFSSCTGYTLGELRKLDIVILTFSYVRSNCTHIEN